MDEWMDGSVVVVQRGVSVSVAARRTPVPTISTFGTLDLAEPVSAISPSPYFQHSLKAKTHTLKTSHRHDRCGDGRRAMMENDGDGGVEVEQRHFAWWPRSLAALARSETLTSSSRERAPTRVCVRRYEPASRPLCLSVSLCLVVAVASYLSRPLAISRTSVSS